MAPLVLDNVQLQNGELPVQQHMCYAGFLISCIVVFVGLMRFVFESVLVRDQIETYGNEIYRWWIPMLCMFLPLGILPIQACGLMPHQRGWLWHSRLTFYGNVVFVCCNLYSGTWLHEEVHLFRGLPPFWLSQISLCFWEVGNGCPRTSLQTRIAPSIAIVAAAYGAVVKTGTRRDACLIHIGIVITISFTAALHYFTCFMGTTLIDLKDSKAVIQHQRDVYLGLLEKATDGWCSFGELNEQGPHFTEVSPKLRNLFGIGSGSVPISHILNTAGIQQILHLAHAAWEGEEEPEVIIVTCITLRACPSTEDESVEFEVRVFPFRPPGGRVSFCFQLASEKRRLRLEDTPGFHRTCSPGHQVGPVQQNLSMLQQKETASCTTIADDDYEESSLACGISEYSPFNCSDLQPQRSSPAYSSSAVSTDPRVNASLPVVGAVQTRPQLFAEVGVQAGRSRPPRIPGGSDTKTTNLSHGRNCKRRHRQLQIMFDVGNCALPNFQETPTETMTTMIHEIVDNCNVRGIGCCYWHIGLGKLTHVAKSLSRRGCSEAFKPLSGWQCNDCFTMNDEDENAEMFTLICSFCGNEQSPTSLAKEDRREPSPSRSDQHSSLSAIEGDDEGNGDDAEQCST